MLLKDLWIQDVQDTGVGGDVPRSYAHLKKKYGFAPVVVIPAVRELYGKSLQFVAILFLALNICIPVRISIAPPTNPITILTASEVKVEKHIAHQLISDHRPGLALLAASTTEGIVFELTQK